MGCDDYEWYDDAVSYFGGLVRDEIDPDKPVKDWITYRQEVMMRNCPTCNTPLPENHSAFDLQYVLNAVAKNGGWARFEEGSYKQLKSLTLENGKVATVAASKTTYDKGDIDVEGYYGESALPQGSEFSTFIVLKVDNQFFKKTGRGDSYGEVVWDGDLVPVQAREKTVLVFE